MGRKTICSTRIWIMFHFGTLDPLVLLPFLLDEKGPKNQGRLNRTSPRLPKRLTSRSGSDFCEVKRKRPSVKVKRLVIPCRASPHGAHASPPNMDEVRRFFRTLTVDNKRLFNGFVLTRFASLRCKTTI